MSRFSLASGELRMRLDPKITTQANLVSLQPLRKSILIILGCLVIRRLVQSVAA
jgi:hypothetical protein